MAVDDIQVGRLAIPVVLDMDAVNRQARTDLKVIARRAGEEAGSELSSGFDSGLKNLTTAVKGLIGIEVVQLLSRAFGSFVAIIRESKDAAVEVAQSFLRLGSASKLYGIEQSTLNEMVQRGRTEMHLSAAVANELAINSAKIAGRAGEATRAQELWAAALDLGAANGLNAARVNTALEQSFRGMDEGLNALGLADPGQLYKEWADQAGRTVDSLTDAEKQQAVMNAIVGAAAKVQGEYGRQLQGDVGRLSQWEAQLQKARETIGASLIPVIVNLVGKLEGPLAAAVDLTSRLLESLLSPTERLARQFERLGLAAEEVIPLQLQERIEELRGEVEDLQDDLDDGFNFEGISVSGDMPIAELQRARRELLALQREDPGSGGDRNVQRRRTVLADNIKLTDQLIAKQQALSVTERDLAATQRELDQATDRRDIRREIDNINDQIEALGAEEQQTTALIRQIDALILKRSELEKKLGANQPGAPAPSSAPSSVIAPTSASAASASTAAAETALLRLQDQANQIREQMADALNALTATAMDEALLQLERLEAEARQVFEDLGEAFPDALAKGFATRRKAILAEFDLSEFSRQLDTLAEAPVSEQSTAVLRQHIDSLTEYVDAHGDANGLLAEGTELRKRFNDLLARSTKQLGDNEAALRGEAAEAAKTAEEIAEAAAEAEARARDERIRGLRDQARAIEENVRGALQLAEAIGLIDSEAAQTLQTVAQLATAVGRIAGGDLSAIPSAIGSAASLIQGLFGESESAKRGREAMRSLEIALLELRDAYLGNVSTAQLQSDRAFVEKLAGVIDRRGSFEEVGLTTAQIEKRLGEIDERLGTNLAAIFESKDLRAFREAIGALPAEIQAAIGRLGAFGDDAAGIIDRVNFEFQILGNTNAAERLAAINAALKAAGISAGEFADELEELAGLDLSTEEGQKRRDEIIASVVPLLTRGGADFGDLTPEQIRELFESWADAISEGVSGGASAGVSRSLSVDRTITEVTGSRLLGAVLTGNLFEEATARNTGAILAYLRGTSPLPTVTPPTLAQLGLAGGPTTLRVEFGPMPITVTVSGDTPADWQAAGRQIAAGFNSTIDQQLGDRLRDLERAAGR